MNPLFHLDLVRVRQFIRRLRANPREARKPLLIAAAAAVYLWWFVFQRVAEDPGRFLARWERIRFMFPLYAAMAAGFFTSHELINRWLARWASGSWSVAPVGPRVVARWITGSMLLVDAVFVLLAVVVSAGLSYQTGLNWWREFPFLLLGTALVVALISSAKILVAVWLRLAGPPLLFWSRIPLKLLTSFLALLLVQPLVIFWWLAEFGRQRDSGSVAAIAIVVLAAGAVGLAMSTRHYVAARWSGIVESFELQQTQARAAESVWFAQFLARPARHAVTEFVTLYNLRGGNQVNRWGQTINIGGRRVHMIVVLGLLVLSLFLLIFFGTLHEPEPRMLALFMGAWSGLFATMTIPPSAPVFRLLRMLPVTFGEWIRSVMAFPLAVTGFFLLLTCILVGVQGPSEAMQGCAIAAGLVAAVFPLRLLLVLSLPHAQEVIEWSFLGTLGVSVLLFLYVHPLAAALLLLGADAFLYLKAARIWEHCEEGLHA